jgi:glycosyltransferase 2 family protein
MVISLLVSLAIVAYLFAKLDWGEVWTQLQAVNPWFLAVLPLGFFVMFYLRALRWHLILPNREQLSMRALFDATILGFFASTVLPLRAGEIIRPWLLSRWQPVSFSASLASILIERLSDAVCMLGLLILCLTQMNEVPQLVLVAANALGGLTGILIIVVLISYIIPTKTERFFHTCCNLTLGRFSPAGSSKINEMITEYFIGVRIISTPGQLFMVMFYSLLMWLVVALWYQVLLWGFGIYPSWWVGMMLNVMIALAVAAPSAPGFVGTFQVGCIVALSTIYGYSKEFAMAYSMIAHVIQMALIVIAGIVVLQLRGMKFSQLRKTGD